MTRGTLALLTFLVTMVTMVSGTAQAKFVSLYNHPDLEWYSIETDHFVVHYPVSKRDLEAGNDHYLTAEWSGRKMADAAEEIWAPMCAEFNYYLKEKVHVVVLNQMDDLTGFTIPSWDWIEISANPGGTFYRSRGRMEWFSDVFVHEFAHVVSLKANAAMAEGNGGVIIGGLYQDGINRPIPGQDSVTQVNSLAFGADMRLMDGDSVFWTEGGAEFWSDNTGYNWWTTSRDQNIRTTVLEDRLLEYDEWHNRSFKRGWGDSERYYQQGYSFGLYLRQRFGDQTYARFAVEHGRRWRWDWVTVIEDVLGIDAETLYWDWRNYVTERYQAQYAEVKQRGEVAGMEITGWGEWDFQSPKDRDKWFEKKQWEREQEKEATGTYLYEPRVSSDGRYYGANVRGRVTIFAKSDDQIPAFTGYRPLDRKRLEQSGFLSTSFPANYEHGWDFVPGKEAVVVTGNEHTLSPFALDLFNIRPEFDGYDWNQLYYFEMPLKERLWGNRRVEMRKRSTFLKKHTIIPQRTYKKIPNTLRGADPAVSPDGTRIAYFEYTDGVLNLVTIGLDGSDKKHLTHFDDGTWLQKVDWSPDGKQLVFGIFKNYQQNLYVVNADGSNLRAIMQDSWEELDAHWSADGRIYFSADPDGIFNVYSYDVASGRFTQLTNVIGGASTPQITAEGNLIYTMFTAHGWKLYGLARDEFLNASADHHFITDFDDDDVSDAMAYRDDLSFYAASTTKYKPLKSLIAPTAVPIFRLESNARSNLGLEGGGQIFVQDLVELHQVWSTMMLGEDSVFAGGYTYQGWYPNLTLYGVYYRGKYTRGFMLDEDDDPDTKDDQSIWEIKTGQSQMFGVASLEFPFNDAWTLGVTGSYLQFHVRGASDSKWEPYMYAYEAQAYLNYSNVSSYWARSANLTRGRAIQASGTRGFTDITYPALGGVAIDDGQVLDAYQYNRYEVNWTENIKLPHFWGIPFLKEAQSRGHVFQLDTSFGYIDRNVDTNDEFRAGGQHPYYVNYQSIRPNTQFAGYPGWSLSGETMAIMNLAYRFPLDAHTTWRWGPFTTSGIYMQMGGSAGNLWSYRPPKDENKSYRSLYDDRIAYNPDDIVREIPFVDVAYKNGNRMLYDAFAEIRVASVFRDGFAWNSFVRLAYGFNEIRGYGDVDGDGIFDTSESGVGDELSSETEPAGWRIYLGLGTGW
jgi:hypothetical protein